MENQDDFYKLSEEELCWYFSNKFWDVL